MKIHLTGFKLRDNKNGIRYNLLIRTWNCPSSVWFPMIVKDLVALLRTMPQDAIATLDVDDGMEGNYMPILRATLHKNLHGEFVSLDADIHHTLGKPLVS